MNSIRIGLWILLGASLSFAQTVTGNLDGHVTDPAGAAVVGAQVVAHSLETGVERTTETNEAGYFNMAFLPIGTYDVTVKLKGFSEMLAKGNVVSLNKSTTLALTMQVSTVQTSVTVEESAQLIDVTSGQVRRSIEDTMVGQLPISGRDFRNLVTLFPGFQTNPSAGQNNFTLSSGSTVSFNGTGTRGTAFLTDGIGNDDYNENQNRQTVNVQTVKEMQVLTNAFSAEFGRGLGAVVLVSTKGGTNQMHGEGYWFHSNSALNARGYFANASGMRYDATGKLVPSVAKTSSRDHRLGATAGGAVIKDRLFYFGSFERFWAPGESSVTTYLIPPEYFTPQVNPSLPGASADAAFIKSVAARFPSNLTPNAPAVSAYAWVGSMPRTRHDHDYTGRLDYRVGDKDFVYGRYQWSPVLTGLKEEPVKGENVRQDHLFQNTGVTWTHVFSPTITSEFRAGFGRRNMSVAFLDPTDRPPIMRWSATGFSNIMGNASQYPVTRVQNDYQVVYNVSMQLGSRNTLKYGTDIRRTQLNDRAENYNRGFWQFSSANNLTAFQNFQQGIVQTFTQGFGPSYVGERITEGNFYLQDDFRMSRNLTLNLGARVEYVGAPNEVNGLIPPDYKGKAYFDPRFGFSWSPSATGGFLKKLTGGPGNTAVRGGFGLFHGRVFQSIFAQIGASSRFNPPNAATLSWSNPSMEVANPTMDFVFAPGQPKSQVSLTYGDPNLGMPYTEQWNFTIERQLPWKAALSAGYVGNRGIGLLFYNWGNRAQFPIVSTQPAAYGTQAQGIFTGVLFDKIDSNLFNSAPAPGYISITQPRSAARRPNGAYGSYLVVSNAAWSYYNALQLTYNQRTFKGMNMQVSYTWSKNIDTGSEATSSGTGDINAAVSETQGMRSLRGLSRLAQPQRLVVSYVYPLPLYRDQKGPASLGWAAPIIGRVLGGWQVSGNATFASGNPFTIFLGYDLNGDGIGGDRPFLLDPSILGRSLDNARINPATGRQYAQDVLPLTAFAPTAEQAASKNWPWYPGTGMVGSLGRNTFWSHGQNNWDVSLSKELRVHEKHRFQFRADMYNFFNRVQFDLPAFVSVVDTSVAGYALQQSLGRISATRNSSRNMQMMLKYAF
jgi:hypothetical protein